MLASEHDRHLADVTLLKFLERKLPPDECDRVRDHLNRCTMCLDAFRRVTRDHAKPCVAPVAASVDNPWIEDWWSTLSRWSPGEDTSVAETHAGVPPIPKITVKSELKWRHDLSRGGFGEVRLYTDPSLGRDVAVKFVPTDESHPESQRRFGRECCITANLDHPNVPPVYGVGAFELATTDASRNDAPAVLPSISMRYVAGYRLSDLIQQWHGKPHSCEAIRDKFVDLRILLRCMQDVCRTIHSAHRRGVAHFDLKPTNILIQEDTTYVIDWGLARLYQTAWPEGASVKAIASDQPTLLWERIPQCLRAAPETISGTRGYMAPEQVRGDATVDGRSSDIYSLGAVLFEMLTSQSPYLRLGEGNDKKRMAHIVDETKRPDITTFGRLTPVGRRLEYHCAGDLPVELVSILNKASKHEPSARYVSALDMAADLERFLEGRQVSAHRYTLRERLTLAVREHTLTMLVGFSSALLLLLVMVGGLTALARAWANEKSAHKIADEKTNAAKSAEVKAERNAKAADAERERSDRLKLKIAVESAGRIAFAGDFLGIENFLGELPATWETRYLRNVSLLRATRRSSLSLGTCGILDLSLSANEKHLLAADAAGVVTLWDVPSGKVVRQWGQERLYQDFQMPLHHFHARDRKQPLEKWGSCITAVVWLDDGNQFVVGSTDGRAMLHSAVGDVSRTLVEHPRAILAIGANTDGMVLLGTADGRVLLRSTRDDVAREHLVGDSPVTEIRWNAKTRHWHVSDESGRVTTLGALELDEVTTIKLEDPVWSIDVAHSPDGPELAVTTYDGVRLFHWQSAPPQWHPTGTCKLVDVGPNRVIQRVRFGVDRQQLFGFASDGTLAAWSVNGLKLAWTTRAAFSDERRVALFRNLGEATPPVAIPFVFRRVGACVVPLKDSRQLLASGDDGVTSLWDLPPANNKRTHQSLETLGTSPQLAFDEAGGGQLWSLDRNGTLAVVESATGRVVARRANAHLGGRAGIVAIPNGTGVATVGGDEFLRRWQLAKGVIVPAGEDIRNEHPLMAIAASADGRLLAAMDVRSNLCVWQRDNGELLFRDPLATADDSPPGTGRLAFNPDTTRLAVFGPGQSGYVYFVRSAPWNFRRIPDQLWIAGLRGGTALIWNPTLPDAVLNADDFPRLHSRSFAESDGAQEYYFEHGDSVTVALSATRDNKRIISLEASGKVLFHDSRWQTKILELTSNLANPVDLAADPEQRWLAVSNQAGDIEFWDAGPPASTSATIKSIIPAPPWRSTEIFERTSESPCVALRTVQFDSQDRLCLLATFSRAGDFRQDGELRFFRQAGPRMTSEVLAPAGPESARRMDASAADLVLNRNDEPVAVFRCRTAEKSPYDGKLFLGRKTRAGKWEFETIHDEGNLGFHSRLLLDKDERATRVMHFSFAGFNLLQSARLPDATWSSAVVGRQGDGMNVNWRRDAAGRLHGVGRINRFSTDASLRVYVLLSPDGELIRREVIPFTATGMVALQLTPDGTPVVLEKRFDRTRVQDVSTAFRLTESGWQTFQTLPISNYLTWNIAPNGALHLLDYDRDSRQLSLLTGRGEEWTRAPVGQLRVTPAVSTILYDRAGHPAVFVSSEATPFGWAQIWRETH